MTRGLRYYILIAVVLICTFSYNQNSGLIPIQLLFGNPDKTKVKLSPDGKYISYLSPLNGALNLFVSPIDDLSKTNIITASEQKTINNYYWSKNSQYIIYKQDSEGNENYYLYSYNLKNHHLQLLTPKSKINAVIYGIGKDEIIIGLNSKNKQHPDIYKISLATSQRELILENNRFYSFITDSDLNLRFATLFDKNGNKKYYKKTKDRWDLFLNVPMEDIDNTRFIKFAKDTSYAYFLDSRYSNTSKLKIINLNTKESTILAENSLADINIVTSHPAEKNIQVVSINYDKKNYQILDPAIKTDLEFLKVNNKLLTILQRSSDDTKWLITYHSDVDPVKYYIYDRNNKNIQFLFSNKSELDKYSFFPMYPVTIKSRDNLDLVSYLTLPTKNKMKKHPAEPLPMVLLVHGGPWNRDRFGINPTHQWLASRGYAVLSVNFRGSKGFGKKFLNAGNMEWGNKMQDDLIDAVNWSIKNKIAQADKICIMGSSYGGYAVLSALAFTPDIFTCGISISGPSNLVTFTSYLEKTQGARNNIYKRRIGSWETEEDKEFLKTRSPLFLAHKINKPLLIAHGLNDTRVHISESEQIVREMQKYNIPVQYIVFENEGHNITQLENKISFFTQVDKFLLNIIGQH